uniref:AMP-dependent synthetase/ligase domain-containing protein n=1 Tax=Megaselia scalaris TaxID=36166 RepID=T1GEW1_MEGSC
MSYSKTKYDAEKKIWSGPNSAPIYNEDVSVGQVLYYEMTKLPYNHVLLISADDGKKYTVEEILSKSIRIAVNLKTIYNLCQNDVIGVMSGNSANVMGLLYACLYNGTPINALDSSFSVKDVVHIWSKTRPKIVFCEENCISVVQKSLKKIGLNSPIITLDSSSQSTDSIENLLQPFSHPQFEFFFQPSDLVEGGKQTATILTSSGTSGPPKSVCLSHRDILTWFKSRGFSQRDTALNYSTLFWVSGLTTYLNAGILGCSMVATKKPFSPRSCLAIIEKYKVNA